MNPSRSPLIITWFVVTAVLSGCGTSPHKVHITSEPPGAQVIYNDKVVGETPTDATIEARSGDYSIYSFRLLKDNYKPAKKSFKEQHYNQSVDDVIPEDLHFVLEELQKYDVRLTSDPGGATVTINGEVIGKTPCTWTVRETLGKPRTFSLVASKKGFWPDQQILEEFPPEDDDTVASFPEEIHFTLKR
jgi:hypothetical protein